MLPKTVRAIRSNTGNSAARNVRNILHRARHRVAGRSKAAVIVRSRRSAAIAKAAMSGNFPAARPVTSGVSVRDDCVIIPRGLAGK